MNTRTVSSRSKAGSVPYASERRRIYGWIWSGFRCPYKSSDRSADRKSGKRKSAISTMENRLNEISQKVNQMSGYWEGEAADRAKNLYQKQQEAMQKILQELKGYPDKLLTISGNYSTVEQANQNESGGLKNNIL